MTYHRLREIGGHEGTCPHKKNRVKIVECHEAVHATVKLLPYVIKILMTDWQSTDIHRSANNLLLEMCTENVQKEIKLWKRQRISIDSGSSGWCKVIHLRAGMLHGDNSGVTKHCRACCEVFVTLPVTTAQAERVLSKVDNTAWSARVQMLEEHLEALVLLQCHREKLPEFDTIL